MDFYADNSITTYINSSGIHILYPKKIFLDSSVSSCVYANTAGTVYNVGSNGLVHDFMVASITSMRVNLSGTSFYIGSKFYASGSALMLEINGTGTAFYASGSTLLLEVKGAGVCIPATKKLFLDGGNGTYITEASANNMRFYTGGNLALQIDSSQDIYSGAGISPGLDNSSAYSLGDTSYYWYGLWYGSGGLNAKPCFKDLKNEVTFKTPNDLYNTLPKYGTFKRKEKGPSAELETGFIIDDNESEKSKYDYIVTDSSGNVSMNIDKLIAQMSVAIKDLNSRIEVLENK
jgi:hypothetical protein